VWELERQELDKLMADLIERPTVTDDDVPSTLNKARDFNSRHA